MKIVCRLVYHGRTNDLVQLLTVVQDKGVDLSIGCFLRNILVLREMSNPMMRVVQKMYYLLCIRQLLDRAVHTLLKNHDFLILLFAQAFQIAAGIIKFDQQVIDLKLLRLPTHQYLWGHGTWALPSRSLRVHSVGDYTCRGRWTLQNSLIVRRLLPVR